MEEFTSGVLHQAGIEFVKVSVKCLKHHKKDLVILKNKTSFRFFKSVDNASFRVSKSIDKGWNKDYKAGGVSSWSQNQKPELGV